MAGNETGITTRRSAFTVEAREIIKIMAKSLAVGALVFITYIYSKQCEMDDAITQQMLKQVAIEGDIRWLKSEQISQSEKIKEIDRKVEEGFDKLSDKIDRLDSN